jgi:alkylation response protein AidB-like acyl-CoA dehydrogenase
MSQLSDSQAEMESVEEFRSRVRHWLPGNLPRADEHARRDESIEALTARHRELQGRLWAANLAGIRYPREYGGLGLTARHQDAFFAEAAGYELPLAYAVTHGIVLPTIMDFGTAEQCSTRVRAALRGEELATQLLSEPSGGSDMAGALTRAARDGDEFVVNGAKIWSSAADLCEYGLLLARTDPDLPKHRGLSMLILDLDAPRVTVNPIRLANGSSEFCEEFFDDVRIPLTSLVGELNDGWAVASRMLFHERMMLGDIGMNDSRLGQSGGKDIVDPLVALAQRAGVSSDPVVRQALGEALMMTNLKGPATAHIGEGLRSGRFPGAGASLLKLLGSKTGFRRLEIGMQIAGESGAVWDDSEPDPIGVQWLHARAYTLAGGTTEMQLNQIGERVLGLPRDPAPDSRDVPFSELPHN